MKQNPNSILDQVYSDWLARGWNLDDLRSFQITAADFGTTRWVFGDSSGIRVYNTAGYRSFVGAGVLIARSIARSNMRFPRAKM